MRRATRWLRRAALAIPVWGALHLAVICVDGCTDDGAVADLAVVLGNHVGADGTPSMRLQLRLDAARAVVVAARGGRLLRLCPAALPGLTLT